MNQSWKTAKKLLCVRLDNAGDLLMTLPAVTALKRALPDREITLLCSSAGNRLRSLMPVIDRTMVYDAPWMKATPARRDSFSDLETAAELARRSFDAAVIFTVYSQNPLAAAFLCYVAGIPLRAAFCRENPYQLLTDWLPDPEPERVIRHEVERQLALAVSLGARPEDDRIRVSIPERAIKNARARLAGIGLEPRGGWALLHPGASAPSRMYPADFFARACDLLGGRVPVVFTGSGDERPLVEYIRRRTRYHTWSFAGETGIEELAALVSMASLVITNNTLPAHLAAATGTSVVDLYALTNPQHTPWKVEHRLLYEDVVCKYCYKSVCPRGDHACLRGVPPERVAEAALELLGERKCTLSG